MSHAMTCFECVSADRASRIDQERAWQLRGRQLAVVCPSLGTEGCVVFDPGADLGCVECTLFGVVERC